MVVHTLKFFDKKHETAPALEQSEVLCKNKKTIARHVVIDMYNDRGK